MPHALINNVKTKLGEHGELLKEYVKWLSDRVLKLRNDENYTPPCKVLQIPYCAPYKNLGFNLGTATVINYAHAHDMAVQYWTVNDPEDMAYLVDLGADCIMSDYPDKLYDTMQDKA